MHLLLGRRVVRDVAAWRAELDADADAHRAAGLSLFWLARDATAGYVAFRVDNVERAQAFAAGLEGEYRIVETLDFERAVTIAFAGTVASCETRYRTNVKTAIPVDFDANWVVTIDVDDAGPGTPAKAGERVSFLFHSPTHVFFDRAENVVGKHFRFEVVRTERPGHVQWRNLRANAT